MRRRSADPDALAYLRLVGLGAMIGIPAALLAAVFLALVHDLEHWLWDDLPSGLGYSSPPWFLVIGLPAVGALAVKGRGRRRRYVMPDPRRSRLDCAGKCRWR